MDDSRMFGDNTLWIWILLAFLLFSNAGSGSGLNCTFTNLFGCNNTFMWIIIAIVAYMLLAGDCGGGIFRNELQ